MRQQAAAAAAAAAEAEAARAVQEAYEASLPDDVKARVSAALEREVVSAQLLVLCCVYPGCLQFAFQCNNCDCELHCIVIV